MSVQIAKVEDVMNIVGVQSYLDALSLDNKKLIYDGYQKMTSWLSFQFHYDDCNIELVIDKKNTVKQMRCSCGKDNCPHLALSVMYILSNSDILEEAIADIKSDYDEEFNQQLFAYLNDQKQTKKKVDLELTLKDLGNFKYELQLKIGYDKKYVLKRHLESFFEIMEKGTGEVEFGKNFTYSPEQCFFDSADKELLDFVKFYVDAAKEDDSRYYGYYPKTVSAILLTGSTLEKLLNLIERREFSLERGYQVYQYDGIMLDSPIKVSLSEIADKMEVLLDYPELTPLTSDYSYLYDQTKIYFIGKENGKLFQFLNDSDKKKIYFKKEEYGTFSNLLFPRLKKVSSDFQMTESLKKTFLIEDFNVKYYFEKNNDLIISHIKLCYQDQEQDIMDMSNQIGESYFVRDIEKEKKYIETLYENNFVYNASEKQFVLTPDEDIIAFLQNGLSKISEKYDTFVSKNLKDIRFYPKTNIRSSFGIGSDNILKYEFEIEHVDSNEIDRILSAIKMKKKYYRLKSGDFIALDDKLEQFEQLTSQLDIPLQQLKLGKAELPTYKGMLIEDRYDFVEYDSNFSNLISKMKQFKNIDITFSSKDKKILREYQQTGIKWMLTLSKCGFGGILADEMGLGKSIQTIYYMKFRLLENPDERFLIVVPTSLIYNWAHEFDKFGPDISYEVINDLKSKRVNRIAESNASVLITTYGLLRQDIESYQQMHFNTCIIDEAQAIKNVTTEMSRSVKQIQADTKFALTGTPIENSVLELWSIFDFILPGLLPNLTKFRNMYSVKMIEEESDCLLHLNRQISPFILRRRKSDVLLDLPDKIENNVLVELNEEQKKLYFAQLQRTKQEIKESLGKDGFAKSQILILSLLTKLRQICIDPRLITENYNSTSSKFETLIEILNGVISNGHKVLIFSQFPSALRLLKESLEKEKISYYYLDGSTKSKTRLELVDSFNKNLTNVFLISLKAGGTGLNLTSADIVIHLDPWWNPQIENQATDRTHRIGQKNVVEVIKLIAKGTIEEKIIELQGKKKRLSDQVIEGEDRDQIVLSKLTEKELREILEN